MGQISVNSVTLVGKIAQPPKRTRIGPKQWVMTFPLVTIRHDNKPIWHNIVIRDQLVYRWIKHRVKHHSFVSLTGELDQETWEDRQSGKARYKHIIVVHQITPIFQHDVDFVKATQDELKKRYMKKAWKAKPKPVKEQEYLQDTLSEEEVDMTSGEDIDVDIQGMFNNDEIY